MNKHMIAAMEGNGEFVGEVPVQTRYVTIRRDEYERLCAGVVPEGFALVPVEPTDGCRVEAGFEVIDRKHIPTVTIKMPPISAEDSKGWDRRDKVAQAIRAMLAAAPKGDSHE